MHCIGTDEAGYGPNLGPLVITATLWQVDSASDETDLYDMLAGAVTRRPAREDIARLALADSKLLYTPQQGVKLLERGVLAALGSLDLWPGTWRSMFAMLAPDSLGCLDAVPWYTDYQLALPLEVEKRDLQRMAESLGRAFESSGARLTAVRSRAVFPAQFNDLTATCGTKGEALSELTLGLVAELVEVVDHGAVQIVCDKHGGRNRYARLLQQQFPDYLVETRHEHRDESVYRFGPEERRVECRFRCRGEAFLPTALASMASKYLRELAMRAFNHYWCRLVPDLAPTAGYPVDARRFKAQIAATQAGLGVEDRVLWRER